MMRDAIEKFPEQFLWQPEIKNKSTLRSCDRLIVCGMGGSHLAADVFAMLRPHAMRAVHMSYGLPDLAEQDFATSLVVVSSYSGNTEEVLEAYEAARARHLNMAAVAVGGELLTRAKRDGVAYIQFADTGIQPRMSLGFGVCALATLVGDEGLRAELALLAKILSPAQAKERATELVNNLKHRVPLVYASETNRALAMNWKIKFNENTKIPACANALPELNHNEMTGFDTTHVTAALSSNMTIIFLRDAQDDQKIKKRMDVTECLYRARAISTLSVDVVGATRAEQIFSNLLLADWVSVLLGESYGVETEAVPLVEEFKKMLS